MEERVRMVEERGEERREEGGGERRDRGHGGSEKEVGMKGRVEGRGD